jgi:predicted O-methyltransferase YrrM
MLLEKFLLQVIGFLSHNSFANKMFKNFENRQKVKQNALFSSLGLDRSLALVKLNKVLEELYGITFNEKNGMWSEHLVLFAAFSEGRSDVHKILEIGTFNGETAKILSRLFPNSLITTIDLPSSELSKSKIYGYETKNDMIISKREKNLRLASNVNFKEMNSLELIHNESKYDLIWIDGDHSYPTAAIDISNAVRLLTKNGIALCDDVYLHSSARGKNGRSVATIETLKHIKDSNLINFYLIHKRLGYFFNSPKCYKKFLGLITLKKI